MLSELGHELAKCQLLVNDNTANTSLAQNMEEQPVSHHLGRRRKTTSKNPKENLREEATLVLTFSPVAPLCTAIPPWSKVVSQEGCRNLTTSSFWSWGLHIVICCVYLDRYGHLHVLRDQSHLKKVVTAQKSTYQ